MRLFGKILNQLTIASLFVLKKIEQMPEEQIEYLEEKFVTPDGKDIELKPNGKNILLT